MFLSQKEKNGIERKSGDFFYLKKGEVWLRANRARPEASLEQEWGVGLWAVFQPGRDEIVWARSERPSAAQCLPSSPLIVTPDQGAAGGFDFCRAEDLTQDLCGV